MLVLKIATDYYGVYTETAATMEELKRIVLDNYNPKGFSFYLEGNEEKSTTFHKFFRGIKVVNEGDL